MIYVFFVEGVVLMRQLILWMGQSFPKAKAFYVKSRSGPIGIKSLSGPIRIMSHSRPIGIESRSEPIEIQGDTVYMASANATSFAMSVKG